MITRSPLPERRCLYVIGDIHGRLDLLDRAIEQIRRDVETPPGRDALTVTLGDYIDRGPTRAGSSTAWRATRFRLTSSR